MKLNADFSHLLRTGSHVLSPAQIARLRESFRKENEAASVVNACGAWGLAIMAMGLVLTSRGCL